MTEPQGQEPDQTGPGAEEMPARPPLDAGQQGENAIENGPSQ